MLPLNDFLTAIKQSNCELSIDSSIPNELRDILLSIQEQNISNLEKIGAFDDEGAIDIELCEHVWADIELFNESLGKTFNQKFTSLIQSWPLKGDKHELWASACIHVAEFQMLKTCLVIFRYCNSAANTSIEFSDLESFNFFVKCIDRARELLGVFGQLYSTFWLSVHFSEKYDLKYRSKNLSLSAKHQLTIDLANILKQAEQKPSLNNVIEELVNTYQDKLTKKEDTDILTELSHWVLESLPNKNKSELKHDLIDPVHSAIQIFS